MIVCCSFELPFHAWEYALTVMKACGFAYKSQFVWVKNKIGLGFWNRNKHELLLIGTRGHIPAPAPGTQLPSVIDADVGAHSVKPEAALEMIEHYYPNLPKIELHRRGAARPGWDAWGAEAIAGPVASACSEPVAPEGCERRAKGARRQYDDAA